jgi:hypothetical protein
MKQETHKDRGLDRSKKTDARTGRSVQAAICVAGSVSGFMAGYQRRKVRRNSSFRT